MSDSPNPGGAILMAAFLIGLVALGLAVSLLAPFGGAPAERGGATPAHEAGE